MLMIVVIMFGVCWLPLHIFFLVLDFNPDLSKTDQQLFTVIYYTVFWLAMSNSCANPIIYGFTNDSFKKDLASLCQLCFPFCLCLKHIANDRLSVSTYDSVNCKRFTLCRKSPRSVIPGQEVHRHINRVYLELQGDSSRAGSVTNMNELYNQSTGLDELNNQTNGKMNNQNHHRVRRHQFRNHHQLCFKRESGESTMALTYSTRNDYEKISSLSSANGSHKKPTLNSPSSPVTFGYFFNSGDDTCKSKPVQEGEVSERVYIKSV